MNINISRLGKLAALVFCVSTRIAAADCTPDGAAAGSAVTCTGVDANGYINAATGLVISVTSGASVAGTGAPGAIAFGSGSTLTNNGTIADTFQNGVTGTDNNTITNNGTISSTVNDGINVQSGNTINNNGAINAQDDGIDAQDSNQITNSGIVISQDEGINVNDGNTVANSGTVTAALKGVNAGDNLILNNSGTIIGLTEEGVYADLGATITNSGTIRSVTSDGINFQSGTINNSGFIIGDDCGCAAAIYIDVDLAPSAQSVVINNSGTLNGTIGIVSEFSTYDVAITNSGTIQGASGTAILLGVGADTLNIRRTSAINGAIDLGLGADTLATGPGVNAYFVYETAVPETISLSLGQSYVSAGLTAIVYSAPATSFAGRGLSQTLSGLSAPLGGLQSGISTRNAAFQKSTRGTNTGKWQSAFAGAELTDVASSTRYGHFYAGALAGQDIAQYENGAFGFYLGGALSKFSNTAQIDVTVSNHFVAGLYRNWGGDGAQHVVSLTYAAGTHQSQRRVSDSGSATGFSDVSGMYGSNSARLSAKSLIAGKSTKNYQRFTEISLSGQVTWSSGYTETGATTNLSFGSETTFTGSIRVGQKHIFHRPMDAEGHVSTSYGVFLDRQTGAGKSGTVFGVTFPTISINSSSVGGYFETVYQRTAANGGVFYVGLKNSLSAGHGIATEGKIGFNISF